MSLRPPSFTHLALILLVIAPLAAWWLVKPVRVLAPGLVGISCSSGPVCVEDPAQQGIAEQLYGAALADVGQAISPLAGAPRVIFCSSEACADSFGLGARSAVTWVRWVR
jgi:hypothetical protein